MAVVLLLGPIVGRRYDPVAALAVSAGMMVLFDPDVLADAGFQLSFGAMLGIACISPHIQKLFTRARVPALLSAPLSVSLGATAATLPLGALLFGWIYLVGPVATLTADLALGPLMVSGIVTSVVGMFGTQAAIIPGLLVWLFSGWLLGSVHFWSSLTWARIDTSSLSIQYALVYYGTLAAAVVMISDWRAQIRLRQVVAARGLALLGAAAMSFGRLRW